MKIQWLSSNPYFLGQENASEGDAGNASEGKGRAEEEGSFDGALPIRRAGGGQVWPLAQY